jgi:hypothetical protein
LIRYRIFIIRAILGIAFAFFLTRFFFGSVRPLYVTGLAVFMIGLAYFLEYWRAKKQNDQKGGSQR